MGWSCSQTPPATAGAERERTLNSIILIGMPGSGKSTVGVILAKLLGSGFVDTDLVIQQREGRKLHEILTGGVELLLQKEEEALLAQPGGDLVIATGGTAVLSERGMAHLKMLGRVVYLEYPLPVLARRLGDFAKRGIAAEPGTTLEEIYAVRAPLYRRYADVTVRPEGSADDTAQRVLRALVER